MAAQSSLSDAFVAFRKSFGRERKPIPLIKQIEDALNALEEGAFPKAETTERATRLVQVLSKNVSQLHKARARATLVFCASAIHWLYNTKLEPAVKSSNKEALSVWEDTILDGLISPILDICGSESQDPEMFAEVIYPVVCSIMCSSHAPAFDGRFARSLALVLLEACVLSRNNKLVLHDPGIFGVSSLSKLIIDARDYNHLDTLLELSFKMFSSQNGKLSRKSYANALFDNEYAIAHLPQEERAEISRIHEVTSDKNSEKHVLDIIRAMSSAWVQRYTPLFAHAGLQLTSSRPQIFATQDLCYCGTKYMQQAPGNVIVIDHKSLCVIICDKDNETDVLAIQLEFVEKIELCPQNSSRASVRFTLLEAPLVFSIRESVATPASHPQEVPLYLGVSIASSDVASLEATLVARDLANKIVGDGMLSRRSTALGIKLSQAKSGIELAKRDKHSNKFQDKADEMMDKYVNMPSSPGSPPRPAIAEPGTPKKSVGTSGPPTKPPQIPVNPSKPQIAKKSTRTPVSRPAPSAWRSRRAGALQAPEAIEKPTAINSDPAPEVTPEHPRRVISTHHQLGATDALLTPPDTRRAKLAGKAIVPRLPDVGNAQPQSPSSPISMGRSPTSKIASKRKRDDDDDPIEPPVDTPDFATPQDIVPRDTSTARAKVKCVANKRIRIPSPAHEPEEGPATLTRMGTDAKPTKSNNEKFGVNGEDAAVTKSTLGQPAPATRSACSTATREAGALANPATSAKETRSNNRPLQQETTPTMKGNARIGVQRAQVDDSSLYDMGETKRAEISKREPIKIQAVHSDAPILGQEMTCEHNLVDVETVEPGNEVLFNVNQQIPSSQDELLAALAKAAQKATRFVSSKQGAHLPDSVGSIDNKDSNCIDVWETDVIEDLQLHAGPHTYQSQESNAGLPVDAIPSLAKQDSVSLLQEQTPKTKGSKGAVDGEDIPKASLPKRQVDNDQTQLKEHELKDSINLERQYLLTRNTSPGEHPAARQADPEVAEVLPTLPGPITSSPRKRTRPIQPPLPALPIKSSFARSLSRGPSPTYSGLSDKLDEPDVRHNAILQRLITKPVFRSNTDTKALPPASNLIRRQLYPATPSERPTRAEPKHNTFAPILRSPQPGRKSALASPQKRTLPSGGRPSVSFTDTPSAFCHKPPSRSVNSRLKLDCDEDNARILVGASARTGSAIVQIIDTLGAIQMAIAENLGENVKTVSTNARNAQIELAGAVAQKLEGAQTRAIQHYDDVHSFEAIFATQTRGFLEGCNQVIKCNAVVDAKAQRARTKNARAGQDIAGTTINFELPEMIAVLLIPN
ncbi:hypothetical protein RhiJN_28274 [Ceratobasidium sp. AG-Ba]|nr:hypothetical protein RhiJN_28274 [Ceratobasidium sp. AG-Ba]